MNMSTESWFMNLNSHLKLNRFLYGQCLKRNNYEHQFDYFMFIVYILSDQINMYMIIALLLNTIMNMYLHQWQRTSKMKCLKTLYLTHKPSLQFELIICPTNVLVIVTSGGLCSLAYLMLTH